MVYPRILYSSYVLCFNNSGVIKTSLRSLQLQTIKPAQLFLTDDGSTDDSRTVADQLGVDVLAMDVNQGRGAARAASIDNADYEFVVCCDATNYLPSDYVARSVDWFRDPRVAAVYGPITQDCSHTLADRWRGRHLFRMAEGLSVQHHAGLCTWGCVVRASSVREVGNFNPRLRHSEDIDLGRRLLDAGFDVVFDPSLCVYSSVSNTIPEVLERYWRWYVGVEEKLSFYGYAKQVWYSIKVMSLRDLRDGDFGSILLSLFSPHYQFWKTFCRVCSGRFRKH